LSQKQLTELFGKAKGTISEHIKHIFEDGEQDENSVVRLFRTTAADGKQYEVAHYSLDMVLALGFRVRSPVGVRFRRWANDKLKEFIVKGFVLDDARLKTFAPASGAITKKSPIFTPPAWTTTATMRSRRRFLPQCKTKCITPCTARRLPS
jgi:hypothetical protein